MMNRPTRPPPAYELSFGVEAKLGHGEVIYVCGSCPSLGAKDPSRALRLVTDPSSYPVWSSDPVPVPLDKKVTYRYCVVAGGKLKRWEDISVDRWVRRGMVRCGIGSRRWDGCDLSGGRHLGRHVGAGGVVRYGIAWYSRMPMGRLYVDTVVVLMVLFGASCVPLPLFRFLLLSAAMCSLANG